MTLEAKVTARFNKAGLTIQFDRATLMPEFHLVSIIVTTPMGTQLAWLSKSFTTFEQCYQYLYDYAPTFIARIPSVEKVVRSQND